MLWDFKKGFGSRNAASLKKLKEVKRQNKEDSSFHIFHSF